MRNLIKKIYEILDQEQRRGFVLLLFLIIISSGLELLGVSAILPLVTAVTDPEIIDKDEHYRMIREYLGITEIREFIVVMSVFLAVVYILKNFFLIWMKRMELRYVYDNQKKISVRLVDCYIHQDYIFHVNTNVADLQRNATSDVTSFFTVIQSMLNLITEILVCFILIIYLGITDIWMTVVMGLLLGALLGGMVIILKKRLRKLGERTRVLSALQGKWFLQSFNGIKEIKAANREDYFLGKYEGVYRDYAETSRKQSLLNYMPKPVAEMLCISGVLLFLAVRIVLGTDMSRIVPVLSVFAIAAFRMLPSFNRISGDLGQLMFNKAAVDALHRDMMEAERLKKEPVSVKVSQKEQIRITDEVAIKEVSFAYPAKPDTKILDQVSLRIPNRKAVAFVGPSGAGKTTLADLILGIYTPNNGQILVDGTDISERMEAWHKTIGYIPQTIYLIDDTIRANVAFGIPEDKIDDKLVWQALESAQLSAFIREQPEGLDTNIGDRGVKLSGGQRQRIGIARALYSQPELLILDEATSALDNETEEAVMDAIYHLSGKVTMIIIAHRITTIKSCDLIYRVKEGKVENISYEEAVKG